MKKPTSISMSEDEQELLAAHAAYLTEKTGIPHGRTDVIRHLLKRAQPDAGKPGGTHARLRRAYLAVFGASE
jgi:hypothetical protein